MPPPESIRAFLTRIVDYAGLFPPAKLDMKSTVENYARYLQSDDMWMLGRLIVPAARLDEFEQHAQAVLPNPDDIAEPWQVSALAAAAGSPELEADLARIEAFNLKYEDTGEVAIDVIELAAASAGDIDSALDEIPEGIFAFFELPVDGDPRGLIAALAAGEAGAKVRTGGESPEKYPSSGSLARFIFACAAAHVPFKATAGLHHPLRHQSATMDVMEHGFLNVFLAGCLALTHELSESDLVELLEETSAKSLMFNQDFAGWRSHRIRTENIEDVRAEFAVSFGTCSFDEPREYLRALKLL